MYQMMTLVESILFKMWCVMAVVRKAISLESVLTKTKVWNSGQEGKEGETKKGNFEFWFH